MEKPINPVGWFEIYVNDLNRAKKFYETVFQFQLSKLPIDNDELEMLAFPMDEKSLNASGALVKIKNMQIQGNGTIVYFSCIDCAAEEGRVEGAGGKIIQPKMSIGEHGFVSLVQDSEGNMIGLHSSQ